MQDTGHQLDESRVRAEIERVLSSSEFAGSDRRRCFLSYIVEETLAGRADRLKAYNIATDAFHRGADFDPQQDSIVRIKAGRLRRALDHFYLTYACRRSTVSTPVSRGPGRQKFTSTRTAPCSLPGGPCCWHRIPAMPIMRLSNRRFASRCDARLFGERCDIP